MKTALDLHRDLLGRGVLHEIVRLPYAVSRAEELPAALGVKPDQCLTVGVYVADQRMIAVGLPVDRVPLLGAVLRAANARTLRIATGDEINAATEFPAGLVPPLPLPADMDLFVDPALGQHEVIYAASGEGGTALRIRTAELLIASRARVADLTTPSLADLVVDLDA